MGDDISVALLQILGTEFQKIKRSHMSGGSINRAYKIETPEGLIFMKENDASAFPGMFETESEGLHLLKSNSSLKVPEVFGTTVVSGSAYILLEFLEQGNLNPDFWKELGTGLAKLHRKTNASFGLHHDNYIGSLRQQNTYMQDWPEFFIERRLEPQLELARNNGKANRETVAKFNRLFGRIPEYFQAEPPSLLHGDLWSGNFMCIGNGRPAIFDPAIYYGHRLMDIGMTKLFGGFDRIFYEAYNDDWPLQDNWQDGVEVANLYPLLVHVNLFGGGYMRQVQNILRRYI